MDLFAPTCAFGSAAVWAIASEGYSRVSKDHSVFAVNFARALVALPLFILVLFVVSGGVYPALMSYQTLKLSHFGWLTLSVLTSVAFGDAVFFWSIRFLGVPAAMAIAFCYPVWTVLVSTLFLGEKITSIQLAGVLLTTIGVVTVILNTEDKQSAKTGSTRYLGIFGALLTSLLWSVNSYATSQLSESMTMGNSVRMVIALVFLAGISRIFAPKDTLVMPLAQIRRFLWIFVLEAFLGTYLYVYGLSHSPLAVGVTLSSLSPVLAVPVAVFLKTEKFSGIRTFGICLVVTGVSLLMGMV